MRGQADLSRKYIPKAQGLPSRRPRFLFFLSGPPLGHRQLWLRVRALTSIKVLIYIGGLHLNFLHVSLHAQSWSTVSVYFKPDKTHCISTCFFRRDAGPIEVRLHISSSSLHLLIVPGSDLCTTLYLAHQPVTFEVLNQHNIVVV